MANQEAHQYAQSLDHESLMRRMLLGEWLPEAEADMLGAFAPILAPAIWRRRGFFKNFYKLTINGKRVVASQLGASKVFNLIAGGPL